MKKAEGLRKSFKPFKYTPSIMCAMCKVNYKKYIGKHNFAPYWLSNPIIPQQIQYWWNTIWNLATQNGIKRPSMSEYRWKSVDGKLYGVYLKTSQSYIAHHPYSKNAIPIGAIVSGMSTHWIVNLTVTVPAIQYTYHTMVGDLRVRTTKRISWWAQSVHQLRRVIMNRITNTACHTTQTVFFEALSSNTLLHLRTTPRKLI